MTTAKYYQTTWMSNIVKCIEADVDCVNVEPIAGSLHNSGKYGINGTFFESDLLGVAVRNDTPVGLAGDGTGSINGTSTRKLRRGTFYRISSFGVNATTTSAVHHYRDVSIPPLPNGQVKWAIGGLSLFINEGDSFQNFYRKLDVDEQASGVNDVIQKDSASGLYVSPGNRPRTAIGLLSNGKILLCVFASDTPWYMKAFLESKGCTKGVYLDGGGSSQMRYKTDSATPTYDPSGYGRAVYTMVSVNPTSWI